MKKNKNAWKLTYAAVCLALALVLPFLTGQIPQIGRTLCPMHIPVLLCGFLCGWPYGVVVGFIAPVLRSACFGSPIMFPMAVSMSFELAVYGMFSGVLFNVFPKKIGYTYLELIIAMIGGRVAYGVISAVIAGIQHTEFSLLTCIVGTFSGAIPGIILQLVLIPPVIATLKKSDLVFND